MTKQGRPDLRAEVLAALPGTRAQLAKKAGVSTSTVGKWLAILRTEEAVHVGRWYRSKHGAKRPVFVLGPGQDAKEPATLTNAENARRYNERHPERRLAIRLKYEGKIRYERSKRKSTTWFAALVFQPSQRY